MKRSANPQSQVLTVKQASDELQVCKPTLYTLINSGELPSFKIGRSRRIRRADLDAFIGRRLDAEPQAHVRELRRSQRR